LISESEKESVIKQFGDISVLLDDVPNKSSAARQ
jgi:hypothetical protein